MHVSYHWLCELIPGLDKIPARELADKLTLSGLEVEEFIDQNAKLSGIVVGEVLIRDKHPNADKLSVCRVKAGREEFQVVCGAPNVEAGKKYPFATLGAVMPDGLEIKPVKLRGVESFGMLCSARELGLSNENAGLFELPLSSITGDPVAKALGRSDVIFGLNVTPNRGDALSHWGVARDIAALTGLNFDFSVSSIPPLAPLGRGPGRGGSLTVNIHDKAGAPRYSASQIFGVTVGDSPAWLKNRLEVLGLRSINNIVDATNYVMLLTGHPVHAFDADNISGLTVHVASLDKPRIFKTLDGAERALDAGDLVISDAKDVVALAGIMGGENSEVKTTTKDLVLEVAHFNPDAVRKTSRRLGLSTDSSYRFARFVNPDTILKAHEILKNLILALAGGEAGPIQDFYPEPFKSHVIHFSDSEITRLLGITVPVENAARILIGLGCDVKVEQNRYAVTVPIARSDLTRPADLVEEIARIYGMDKIPAAMPRLRAHVSDESQASRLENHVKDFFVSRGFNETLHYSFGEPNFFAQVLKSDSENFLRLKNPLSEDLAVMRPSLLPQLLATYKKNRLNTDKGTRLFELRKVYPADAAGKTIEKRILCGLYAGNPYGRNPYGLARDSDFYDGKGLLTDFFRLAGISTEVSLYQEWPYHSGQAAAFYVDSSPLAFVGALHPELLQELKIKDKVFTFEIDYDAVAALYRTKVAQYRAISVLPPVYRDLALLAPSKLTHAEVLKVIEDEKPSELKYIELFDLYEGGSIPVGKKSLAYSFVYQPLAESFTDEEVNKMHFALVEKLTVKLGVELR